MASKETSFKTSSKLRKKEPTLFPPPAVIILCLLKVADKAE